LVSFQYPACSLGCIPCACAIFIIAGLGNLICPRSLHMPHRQVLPQCGHPHGSGAGVRTRVARATKRPRGGVARSDLPADHLRLRQSVAAESTQARIYCPALRLTNIARKGRTDACLACARRCHLCLHALPQGPLGRCGRLGAGSRVHATVEDSATSWAKVVSVDMARASDRTILLLVALRDIVVCRWR
jgi:hypothetical protein